MASKSEVRAILQALKGASIVLEETAMFLRNVQDLEAEDFRSFGTELVRAHHGVTYCIQDFCKLIQTETEKYRYPLEGPE